MTLNNKAYDFLKWLITIFLPATGSLYFALSQVWHFPGAENVNGTINSICIFLGLLIGYSTRQYNRTTGAPDGDLIVTADPETGEKYLGLGVNRSVEAMTTKDQVKLNVVDTTAPPPVE